jgi:C_GCAxxG_C_C family probable redox protein
MDKKQTALNNFKKMNCAQAVFSAFAEDVGIDENTALKMSACFGGGMRCGEVCGAATGALMVLGMKYGSGAENDLDNKRLIGQKTTEFIKRFKDKNETLLCREILKKGAGGRIGCGNAVSSAVEILEDMLDKKAQQL